MLFIHTGKYTKYMIIEDINTKIERVLSDEFSTRNYGVRSVVSSVSVRIETFAKVPGRWKTSEILVRNFRVRNFRV